MIGRLLLTFLITFLLFLPLTTAFAAVTIQSNPWSTKVGQPTDPDPVGGGGNLSIVEWAEKIAQHLVVGDAYFNYLTQSVSNGTYTSASGANYVCTIIVIDAYNLAGIPGLNRSHGVASEMHRWWKTAPAPYSYIDYDVPSRRNLELIRNVKPGYAVFWGHHAGINDHVGIVERLEWTNEAEGDGTLYTIEANNADTHLSYNIVNFILDPSSVNKASGFGGIN